MYYFLYVKIYYFYEYYFLSVTKNIFLSFIFYFKMKIFFLFFKIFFYNIFSKELKMRIFLIFSLFTFITAYVPKWDPTYQMNKSTFIMPCDNQGYYPA